jgi:hypothetical protein
VNTDNQRESTQETRDFIPWFGQVTLAYFHVVALHSTPFQLSDDQLEYHGFPFLVFLLFARNLHNLEPLALTMMITKEAQK